MVFYLFPYPCPLSIHVPCVTGRHFLPTYFLAAHTVSIPFSGQPTLPLSPSSVYRVVVRICMRCLLFRDIIISLAKLLLLLLARLYACMLFVPSHCCNGEKKQMAWTNRSMTRKNNSRPEKHKHDIIYVYAMQTPRPAAMQNHNPKIGNAVKKNKK